jgi:hypothetical protein
VLVVLGTLDLAVALLPRPTDETIAGLLGRMSLILIASAGALQLTCAALILMRRRLGRSLYLYGMPATLVLGGALSYLRVAAQAPSSAGTSVDLLAAGLGWLLSVAFYAVIAYALTRPGLAAWLGRPGADPSAVPEPAARTRPALLAGLVLRIAAFAALLAFMVLALDAPVSVLYVGGVAIVVMVALRYLLVQRLTKTSQNDDNGA